jgi:hypothetical protein
VSATPTEDPALAGAVDSVTTNPQLFVMPLRHHVSPNNKVRSGFEPVYSMTERELSLCNVILAQSDALICDTVPRSKEMQRKTLLEPGTVIVVAKFYAPKHRRFCWVEAPLPSDWIEDRSRRITDLARFVIETAKAKFDEGPPVVEMSD